MLLRLVLIFVGVLPLVVGCGGAGVLIPDGYDGLSQCEVRQYGVDELSALGEPHCDLEGSSVLFPDGTVAGIQEVGAVVVESDDALHGTEYHSVNWGVPGSAVAMIEDGTVHGVWATSPEALDLHRQQLRIDGYRLA